MPAEKSASPADSGARSPADTRVDPPHTLRRHGGENMVARVALSAAAQATGSPSMTGAQVPYEEGEAPSSWSDEAVALQAAELAQRLQQEQQQLDRRLAALNAQEAQIENKLRQARLWFEERQRELDAREELLAEGNTSPTIPADVNAATAVADEWEQRQRQLDARQADLYRQVEEVTEQQADVAKREELLMLQQEKMSERAADLATRSERLALERQQLSVLERTIIEQQAAFESRHQQMEERESELGLREQQLVFRQQEITTALARFEKLGVCQQRMDELVEQAQQYAARARYLDEAESLLSQESQALAARRQQLDDDHRTAEQRLAEGWRALNIEREQHQVACNQTKKQLERREAALDGRDESLQQLRVELEETQREVLEMRLATEETWAQLTGALTPASLSRSISQTRAQLADHFEHQLRELADRRSELERLREELAREHHQLQEHRSEMQAWVKRREQETEKQAGRLIAREQELDRQQAHYESLEGRWKLERDDYRSQIRRLMSELRSGVLEQAA